MIWMGEKDWREIIAEIEGRKFKELKEAYGIHEIKVFVELEKDGRVRRRSKISFWDNGLVEIEDEIGNLLEKPEIKYYEDLPYYQPGWVSLVNPSPMAIKFAKDYKVSANKKPIPDKNSTLCKLKEVLRPFTRMALIKAGYGNYLEQLYF